MDEFVDKGYLKIAGTCIGRVDTRVPAFNSIRTGCLGSLRPVLP